MSNPSKAARSTTKLFNSVLQMAKASGDASTITISNASGRRQRGRAWASAMGIGTRGIVGNLLRRI